MRCSMKKVAQQSSRWPSLFKLPLRAPRALHAFVISALTAATLLFLLWIHSKSLNLGYEGEKPEDEHWQHHQWAKRGRQQANMPKKLVFGASTNVTATVAAEKPRLQFLFPGEQYRIYRPALQDLSARCNLSKICEDSHDCGPDGLGCITSAADRLKKVKAAAEWSWLGYKKFAWGHDEMGTRPGYRQIDWMHVGLTIVDSLDTLLVLDMHDEYKEARDWVLHHLKFQRQEDGTSVFETTIRILGGLLSAFYLSNGDKGLLHKAVDVAERLLVSFATPNGIATITTDLSTKHSVGLLSVGRTNIAAAGTTTLEFSTLARLTGRKEFVEAPQLFWDQISRLESCDGLYCTWFNANDMTCLEDELGFGASADSVYEYMLKQWIMSGKQDEVMLQRYMAALHGMRKHLVANVKPIESVNSWWMVGIGRKASMCESPSLISEGHQMLASIIADQARRARRLQLWHGVAPDSSSQLHKALLDPASDSSSAVAHAHAPAIQQHQPATTWQQLHSLLKRMLAAAEHVLNLFGRSSSSSSSSSKDAPTWHLINFIATRLSIFARPVAHQAASTSTDTSSRQPQKPDRLASPRGHGTKSKGTSNHIRMVGNIAGMDTVQQLPTSDKMLAGSTNAAPVMASNYSMRPNTQGANAPDVIMHTGQAQTGSAALAHARELLTPATGSSMHVGASFNGSMGWSTHAHGHLSRTVDVLSHNADFRDSSTSTSTSSSRGILQLRTGSSSRGNTATLERFKQGRVRGVRGGQVGDVGRAGSTATAGAGSFQFSTSSGDSSSSSSLSDGTQYIKMRDGSVLPAAPVAAVDLRPVLQHFTCFVPGMLTLGHLYGVDTSLPTPPATAQPPPRAASHPSEAETDDDLLFASKLMVGCYELYRQSPTGVAPDAVEYISVMPPAASQHLWSNSALFGTSGAEWDSAQQPPPALPPPPYRPAHKVKTLDSKDYLRPEVVESLFYLYRATGDEVYREWGWQIFRAFELHCRLRDGGYATLNNANTATPFKGDRMESFWLAETLKYLYLLFSDDSTLLPLDQYVFNTEAHPLPVWGSAVEAAVLEAAGIQPHVFS